MVSKPIETFREAMLMRNTHQHLLR